MHRTITTALLAAILVTIAHAQTAPDTGPERASTTPASACHTAPTRLTNTATNRPAPCAFYSTPQVQRPTAQSSFRDLIGRGANGGPAMTGVPVAGPFIPGSNVIAAAISGGGGLPSTSGSTAPSSPSSPVSGPSPMGVSGVFGRGPVSFINRSHVSPEEVKGRVLGERE